MGSSFFAPSFATRLADPEVRTVLLCGCGGGFDFVHGLMLIPELRRLGKRAVVASYSFGSPHNLVDAPVVWTHSSSGGGDCICKRVTAQTRTESTRYSPEIGACRFLDERFPDAAPHSIYAMYARAFTVPALSELYAKIAAENDVDGVVLCDGGSDSLMRGDEQGLGDPVEDAVSVATVAWLETPARPLRFRMLLTVGLGCDRHNCVSDASSLRAIAELQKKGGFLGCVSLEHDAVLCSFYRDLLARIYSQQSFRSVIAGSIVASSAGHFGTDDLPQDLAGRVGDGNKTLFLWPLMAMFWAFDVRVVAERSLIAPLIRDAKTVDEATMRIVQARTMELDVRPVENLPRHEEIAWDHGEQDHFRLPNPAKQKQAATAAEAPAVGEPSIDSKDTCAVS